MSNDATEQVRKVWDDQAQSWYAERESILAASRPVHEWLVRQVDPKPGQRVLEIAAGPGDTGFLAAPRLGRDGCLVSTDLAPSMVDVARKRGAELGVTNAEYRVLDAQAMDFEDASFDGILCRWAFMLMPDPGTALRECRRVLKPGGRLAFAVFTSAAENPFASLPMRVLRESGHLPPPTGEWQPGINALGDRVRLQALLDSVGFASTQIEGVDMTWTFATVEDYWTFLVEVTAFGPMLRGLSDSDRETTRATINTRLAAFAQPTGFALPSRCWGGLAIA
jgi:ubiquinone/menaquinone biosynthesis C-methylase UbiE